MKKRDWVSTLAVAICLTGICTADEFLTMKSKEWKYFDGKEDPGKEWMKPKFDDSKWKEGQAILGYGDEDQSTKLSFGDDEANKRLCAFFRKTIEIEDPNAFKVIIAKIICDDGAVVYLNGEEVHRHNMAKGDVKQSTAAQLPVGGVTERVQLPFLVDAKSLKAGKNTIAVRVHQCNGESSDLAFDFSLEGTDDMEKIETATTLAKQVEQVFNDALKQQAQEREF